MIDDLRERLRKWQEEVGARFPVENPEYERWPDRSGPSDSE